MADDSSVPLAWILLFFLLALGLTVLAISYVGGSVFAGTILVG